MEPALTSPPAVHQRYSGLVLQPFQTNPRRSPGYELSLGLAAHGLTEFVEHPPPTMLSSYDGVRQNALPGPSQEKPADLPSPKGRPKSKCAFCACTTSSNSKKRHAQSHYKKHVCPHCQYSTLRRDRWLDHHKKHHEHECPDLGACTAESTTICQWWKELAQGTYKVEFITDYKSAYLRVTDMDLTNKGRSSYNQLLNECRVAAKKHADCGDGHNLQGSIFGLHWAPRNGEYRQNNGHQVEGGLGTTHSQPSVLSLLGIQNSSATGSESEWMLREDSPAVPSTTTASLPHFSYNPYDNPSTNGYLSSETFNDPQLAGESDLENLFPQLVGRLIFSQDSPEPSDELQAEDMAFLLEIGSWAN